MRFAGRTVLVTGSSSGIGLATAKAFAAEGAAVVMSSTNAEELSAAAADVAAIQGSGRPQPLAVVSDVSNEADWHDLRSQVLQRFGALDVLVNNAGVGFRGTVLDTDVETWDRLFSVNVRGVFLGCKTFIPEMIERQKGSIVNVSSVAGHAIAMPHRAAYVATKGAVNALTKSLAIDHSADGVRINAVAPGTTDSPYFQKFQPDHGNREEYRAMLANRQLMKRMADPSEIASAIIWMASDEASFCTGTILDVDGGWSVW